MANKLIMKKSSVVSKVPLATDLDIGELAVNLADQKLYSKNSSGTVILVGSGLGGSGGVQGPASSTDNALARFNGTNGTVIKNSTATVDDSGNLSVLTSSSTGTGANKMPVGTTAQRPASPQSGHYRLNSDYGIPEWYDSIGSRWLPFFDSRISYEIEILLVAGGGGSAGGSAEPAGGGGAGGMITTTYKVENGAGLSIVIGNGGAGAAGNSGASSGSQSTIAYGGSTLFTAVGGGAGGNGSGAGGAGGSGGGGSGRNGGGASGAGTSGQGNNGGAGGNGSGAYASGGGGGKSAVGVAATSTKGGDGGAGGLWGGSYYAGGGGGGVLYSGTTGSGGIGGGGNGCAPTLNSSGTGGTANTGGGGGAANGTGTGGSGGKGVCVIRYAGGQRGSGGTVTSSGGYTYHTFTKSGTYTA